MPIHDWSRVDAGIFHDFHQGWTIAIANALNGRVLPADYFSLTGKSDSGSIREMVTLQQRSGTKGGNGKNGGIAVADAPPRARFMSTTKVDPYVARANSIVIQHQLGRVVAVVEIVSPGNKSGQHALRALVDKARNLLANGVNLLIVDLFPPSRRDPQGIHKAIWDTLGDEPFELPPDKPLTVAAYMADSVSRAYVDPVAVGDELPSLPIFLDQRTYVPAPLESTYQSTWSKCPKPVRELVENRGA